MPDAPHGTAVDESTRSDSIRPASKPFRWLPSWWWVFVIVGVVGSSVVALVERAASQLILNCFVFLAVLFPLVRYCFRGPGRFAVRALPLLLFLGTLAAIGASVRIDEMNGNLIPTRWSWKWDKQRDELLAAPTQTVAFDGVDLSQTTENDFPRFLGPRGDGVVDVQLAQDWDSAEPHQVWFKEEFGAGWAGFAAVNGFAVTLEQRGENEMTSCYSIETGDLVWSHSEQARHLTVPGGIGPRSTPTIYNGRVYTLGATGVLLCLDGSDGSVVWKKNLQEEIGTTPEEEMKVIAWGRSSSPLIDEGRVILPLGMPNGASLVAFDALDGTELWRKGEHQVSYASPIVTTLDGVKQIVVVCESEVCGHDSATGEQLWEYPWPGSSSGNASCSQPVPVDENRLFLSKGYAYGAELVEVKQADGAWEVEGVWRSRRVMKTKFTNVVIHDGHVYGLDDGILSCVDLTNGKRKWKRGRYGHGQVLKTQDCLLVQAESGEVALVAFDPKSFQELAKFAPLDRNTWNNPCLYGKYLLVRNGEQAACYLLP